MGTRDGQAFPTFVQWGQRGWLGNGGVVTWNLGLPEESRSHTTRDVISQETEERGGGGVRMGIMLILFFCSFVLLSNFPSVLFPLISFFGLDWKDGQHRTKLQIVDEKRESVSRRNVETEMSRNEPHDQ